MSSPPPPRPRYGPEDGEDRWVRTSLRVLGAVALVAVLFGGAYIGVKLLADRVNRALGGSTGTTVEAGLAVEFVVEAGMPAASIAEALEELGVIESAGDFQRAVADRNASDRLQAGTYTLQTGMDDDDVIDLLLEGPVEEEYLITVIEGLTVSEMLSSIADQTDFTFAELSAALLDGSVTSELLAEEPERLSDWEGLLFPDTYEIGRNFTAGDVLNLLTEEMERKVASVSWGYPADLGLTPYDGIIIASMIEEEAKLDEDRAKIASVIYNRLELDMLLQIDATVIYALGGPPEGGLTAEDLSVDSPYNTYMYKGLPPTPISGVRLASLQAAASPAETDYLYYVLIDEEGRHAFTNDYDEFLVLVQQARDAGLIP
jgi:UPF0755 protein